MRNASYLLRELEGATQRFTIPVYQRNYDWKIKNCEQLFNDLIYVSKNNIELHFFGSIVLVATGHENIIIDGQQRITTISLLLLALYKLLKSGKITAEDSRLQDRILAYLVDSYSPDEYKLKPVKNDNIAYEKLFRDSEDYDYTSNITRNFKYFYDRILKNELTTDQLYDAIGKLKTIKIVLDPRYDEPQKVFESLNSTGLALTEADKIRNFILMGIVDTRTQERFYLDYWVKYENYTDKRVDAFIRDYLTIKLPRLPNSNVIYFEFKDYVLKQQKTGFEIKSILSEILQYAEIYHKISCANISKKKIDPLLQRINLLNISVLNPYLMEMFRCYFNNQITENDCVEILQTIETYIVRRGICDIKAQGLNRIFAVLHNKAQQTAAANTANYADVVKYILLSQNFPNDTRLCNAIETRDFYRMKSPGAKYLFDRLITRDSKEYKPGSIAELIQDGTLTVEHIMPQQLSPQWKEELGENWQDIHEIWLHRIANLTVTAYNSKYSNQTFQRKCEMENGFRESPIHMNQEIAHFNSWNEVSLKQRQDQMKALFLKTWPLPQTKFRPYQKEMELYSLDEDESFFTGKTIKSFFLNGTRFEVDSWVKMLIEITKFLYVTEPAILHQLVKEGKEKGFLKAKPTDEPIWIEIAPKLYLCRRSSTDNKILFLRKLLSYYNMDSSEVEIELSQTAESDS